MDFRVDEEFRALIPPLSPDELAQLTENVTRDGCTSPLMVWEEEGILLDGHNRYDICTKNDVEYTTAPVNLSDRDAAKAWIITNQFGRRNLTNIQRAELALKLKPLLQTQAIERQKMGKSNLDPKRDQGRTLDKLQQVSGLGHSTLHRAEVVLRDADEETKARLRSGETTISREYKRLRGATEVVNTKTGEVMSPEDVQVVETQPAVKKLGKGVDLANEAINCLMRIPKHDPLRNRGFQIVADWIRANK